MPTISTRDGMEIFYKDWGSGQPIVFSHGWPLSADDWDAQLLFFLRHAIALLPMTAVAMAARPRLPTATIWTIMPTTWRL
jgi:pimeloyl-ACP methyl ester carboxylesterase